MHSIGANINSVDQVASVVIALFLFIYFIMSVLKLQGGRYPLIQAAYYGYIDIVEYLHSVGADINVVSKYTQFMIV